MRKELKRPFGKLIRNQDLTKDSLKGIVSGRLVITCGDATTQKVREMGLGIHLAIIDHKTKREDIEDGNKIMTGFNRVIRVRNAPAGISRELDQVLKAEIEQLVSGDRDHVLLDVEGEEDLAFIPCVLYSPEGSVILYGQPNEGMVVAEVTTELKAEIADIHDRMDYIEEITD